MKPFNERINSSFIKKANNKRPLLTVNRQNIPKNKQIRKNFTKHITFSSEDMILALAGQFKQLSHEPEKFR